MLISVRKLININKHIIPNMFPLIFFYLEINSWEKLIIWD
jgi:hypothetical protein